MPGTMTGSLRTRRGIWAAKQAWDLAHTEAMLGRGESAPVRESPEFSCLDVAWRGYGEEVYGAEFYSDTTVHLGRWQGIL